MWVVYNVSEEELNEDFLQSLKTLTKGKKRIRIEVSEDLDETEYLMSSPKNVEMLNESISQIEKGEGLKTVSLDDLKRLIE